MKALDASLPLFNTLTSKILVLNKKANKLLIEHLKNNETQLTINFLMIVIN